jgi:Glyoxalase-like domain
MAGARTIRESTDHLLLGARDLDEGVAWLDAHTGVKAQPGGSHPGVGTRNALISLGGRQYLEIIAPDPAQAAFNFNVDLRALAAPRLVTWAVSTPDVDAAVAAARRDGLEILGPRDGSRTRPDGSVLRWRSAGMMASFAEVDVDPVPFFIQWAADSRHPSSDAPSGCRLVDFALAGPDPVRLEAMLASLGVDATVGTAAHERLSATLDTPRGRVTIT